VANMVSNYGENKNCRATSTGRQGYLIWSDIANLINLSLCNKWDVLMWNGSKLYQIWWCLFLGKVVSGHCHFYFCFNFFRFRDLGFKLFLILQRTAVCSPIFFVTLKRLCILFIDITSWFIDSESVALPLLLPWLYSFHPFLLRVNFHIYYSSL
jgi:hypothetical protein